MVELRAVLAGGGTAGHVNPLLATAAALDGAALTVLGTREGMEARLVPEAGLTLRYLPRVPLPRRPSADLLRLPFRLSQAVRSARSTIREHRADVVVGFGGYVATPAYLAARRQGVPVVIHEQNAVPGIANRLGARWAAAVATTFPATPLRGATVLGMPLRAPIAELIAHREADPASVRAAAAAQLGLDPARTTLLVTGGSLGAQRINEAVSANADALDAAGIQVLHLTGHGKDEPVRAQTSGAYHVLAYLDDMALAYACADLVVCRAGAGTVSELAALGIPAVYVPLPIGNGEQHRNAAGVVAAGGGLLVEDGDLTAATITARVLPLLRDPEQLATMGRHAAAAGVRDGAQRLAELITKVAREGRS